MSIYRAGVTSARAVVYEHVMLGTSLALTPANAQRNWRRSAAAGRTYYTLVYQSLVQ